MYQKVRNIIIIFILLVSTTGVSISKHYSGGKLFSISFIGDAKSCCDVPCNCCDDETDFLKLDVNYLISSFDNPEIKTIDLFSNFNLILKSLDSDNIYSEARFKFYPDISPPEEKNHLSFFQSFLC